MYYNSLRGYRQRVGVWCVCFRYAVHFLAFLSRGNNYLAVFSLLDCTKSVPRNVIVYLYIHLRSPSSMRIRSTSLRTQLRGVTSMFLAARLSSIVSAFHHWDERYIRGPIGTSVVFRIVNWKYDSSKIPCLIVLSFTR